MPAIKNIDLTAYGQLITGVQLPIGSTADWNIDLQDPNTRDPYPIVEGDGVVMSMCAIDMFNNPVQPALIARQATVIDGPSGSILVPWAVGDTAPVVVVDSVPVCMPLAPGFYFCDLWLTDADGNRIAMLGRILLELLAVATLPTTTVTPLPSQPPLGQGPSGVETTFSRVIAQPADGMDFLVIFADADPPIPDMADTNYVPRVTIASDSGFAMFNYPLADRTVSQFRVTASGLLDDGTLLQVQVFRS